MEMPASRSMMPGSARIASARFVSGPVAITHKSETALDDSMRHSNALVSLGLLVTGGSRGRPIRYHRESEGNDMGLQ